MEHIINIALQKKGQFGSAVWGRQCKTLKSCTGIIEKVTEARNIRIGCAYDNLGKVKEARESGELPEVNQGLKGLQWKAYPVILENANTGKQFVRIETAANSVFKTKFLINGKEVEKKDIECFLQASEKRSGSMPMVINVGVENFIALK